MTSDCLVKGDPYRLRASLLDWYHSEGRPLPWRTQPSLYGTWISEIMLQQTAVLTVVPFWERFMARWPDVTRLATASEVEVLTLWSGLGYYRRARSLHRAARQIVTQRGGALPTSFREWLALPGIGRYSAGAIASIGLGERVCAVDANARRVLSRWLFADPQAAAGCSAARLEAIAGELVDPLQPGDWNQAVMELGATRCQARRVACSGCPAAPYCRAQAAGTAEQIPPPRSGPEPIAVVASYLVWRDGDSVALVPPGADPSVRATGLGRPLRHDFSTLHPGLWNLPGTPWYRRRRVAAGPAPEPALFLRAWRRWLPSGSGPEDEPRLVRSVTHAITHHRLKVQVVAAGGPTADVGCGLPPGMRRVRAAELDALPLSNLARKCLAVAMLPG